ncbi:MAG: hypothetical protein Q4D89_06105 [Arachnia propionica]|uniref:hypothetical protein n=1 Tax=Arachnia propionica TaxID=1750 RepID=UPI002700BA4E|nr:hypothetical protein [Arachnia propionica]
MATTHQQPDPPGELALHQLRTASPIDLSADLEQLLQNRDEAAAHAAAQRIEGAVCPARELYEAAEAVTQYVTSKLATGVFPVAALDLLVEIAHGEPAPVEQIEQNHGIALRCAGLIREVLPTLYASAETSDDESLRQGVIDLAIRLEPAPRMRRKLLDEFDQGAHGVYLQRALKDLEKHLDSPTLQPEALPGTADSFAQLLQGTSGWNFCNVFGIDLGGKYGQLGLAMQVKRDGVIARLRVVCEGVDEMLLRGRLRLVDGSLEMSENAGHWWLELQQGDLQLRVRCTSIRMTDPWTETKEVATKSDEGKVS